MLKFILNFFLLLLFLSYTSHGQDSIKPEKDSLISIINNSQDDKEVLSSYTLYLKKYKNPDLNISEKALASAKKIENDSLLSIINYQILIHYYFTGNYSKALDHGFASALHAKKINNMKMLGSNYNAIASIYYTKEEIKKAQQYYLKALSIAEQRNDLEFLGKLYYNMGLIMNEIKDTSKALGYYHKAIETNNKIKNEKELGNIYNALGVLYKQNNDIKTAKKYYQEAIKNYKKYDDNYRIAETYANLGSLFMESQNQTLAIDYLLKSETINNEINSKAGNLQVFIILTKAYIQTNDLNKAENYLKKLKVLNNEIGHTSDYSFYYQLKSDIFKAKQQNDSALYYYKQFVSIEDSIRESSNINQVSKLELEYYKEKEIKLVEEQKKVKELQLKQNQLLLYFSIGGGIIFLLLLILAFRSFLQKKKDNKIIYSQKMLVEEKQKEIIDSINYAKHLQTNLLPGKVQAAASLGEHFILFKPKDIVSGDFYWMHDLPNNPFTLLAVADCTGHGVPGGFISMLGLNYLHQASMQEGVENTKDGLTYLDESLRGFFKAKQQGVVLKDGMDICFTAINKEKNYLEFTGARNPLYLISEGELKEVKGDKKSIGEPVYDKWEGYNCHKVNYKKGDVIYLFSDGFADQFGGEYGKKYKYSNFKKFLVSISDKDMEEQKKLLVRELDNWMGNEQEQIDDITIIGVRL